MIPKVTNPYVLFGKWFTEAKKSEVNNPNAMCLATVDRSGFPNARMVLLKDYNAKGFVFYTNYESAKGEELLSTGEAALCFYWKSLQKQIRVTGRVVPVSEEEADAYFSSRPRGSQIGAWASQQSRPIPSRETLLHAIDLTEKTFEGKDIPRPDYWSGFRVIPDTIEFWQEMPYRLHDRVLYEKKGKGWKQTRLFP